jgi:hypothetical protein
MIPKNGIIEDCIVAIKYCVSSFNNNGTSIEIIGKLILINPALSTQFLQK